MIRWLAVDVWIVRGGKCAVSKTAEVFKTAMEQGLKAHSPASLGDETERSKHP